MKKSDELKKQIADLTDEAQAFVDLAESEKRELTADEQTRWAAIMDKEKGELAQLDGKLKAALAHEEQVSRLRAARESTNTPAPEFNRNGSASATPALPQSVRVISPTLRAFKGNGDKEQALKDAYDCGLWFKSILFRHTRRHDEGEQARNELIARRGESWYATQNETTPTDGGYLVPPQFENAVLVFREQVGALRRLARIVPMTSDTWTGMKQTSGTTVYYPGEETAITASDANFSRYSLNAKKRAILAYVSSELRADAAVSIMDLLAQDMAHQFALKEDQEGIIGDGTSTYGGVQGIRPAVIAATASVYTPTLDEDAWSEVTAGTLLAGMSLVADKYRAPGNLKWLISQPAKWQIFDRLALAQGGAAAAEIVGGINGGTFMGYPVVVSDRMPTTEAVSQVFAIFGNFMDAVLLGQRSGIEVAVSEHYAFNTDQIAVRATTRYDIHVHEEGDTSTAGAIVGVATHS